MYTTRTYPFVKNFKKFISKRCKKARLFKKINCLQKTDESDALQYFIENEISKDARSIILNSLFAIISFNYSLKNMKMVMDVCRKGTMILFIFDDSKNLVVAILFGFGVQH